MTTGGTRLNYLDKQYNRGCDGCGHDPHRKVTQVETGERIAACFSASLDYGSNAWLHKSL